MKKVFSIVFLLLALTFNLSAQDITKGTWYNEEKNAKLLFKVNNGREPTATELKDFVVKYKKGFSQ